MTSAGTAAIPALWEAPIPDPIARWARDTPGAVAVRDQARDTQWSYAALDLLARRWIGWLAAAGVGAGDRVAVLATNRVEHVALWVACARLGAALVPLNWRLALVELEGIVADAAPTVCLAAGCAATTLGGVRVHALDEVVLPEPVAPAGPTLAVPSSAVAMLLYTSGTTGRPKGAMLTHGQLLANAVATVAAWQLSARDVAPISTPFFHTGGWHVFSTPLWWVGGSVLLLDGFDPARFLDTLAEGHCTVAFAVPTQLTMLLDQPGWGRPLPTLRWLIVGGAPCPLPLATQVRAAGYRLREGFGMTEFGPNCFAISDDEAVARPGSVGWPVPFAELRLVDEAGRDVPDGVPGELWLRGPQRFAGYFRDAMRTAEAITPDGWYRSGDLLVRDADGAYAVRGRRKEMFISGGENIFPAEVETAVAANEAIAEVCVVAMPDGRWGEVGCAFVVPRAGRTVDGEGLRRELRTRLAGYKVPKVIQVLDALPRLGSGKVDRAALARRATAMAGPPAPP